MACPASVAVRSVIFFAHICYTVCLIYHDSVLFLVKDGYLQTLLNCCFAPNNVCGDFQRASWKYLTNLQNTVGGGGKMRQWGDAARRNYTARGPAIFLLSLNALKYSRMSNVLCSPCGESAACVCVLGVLSCPARISNF